MRCGVRNPPLSGYPPRSPVTGQMRGTSGHWLGLLGCFGLGAGRRQRLPFGDGGEEDVVVVDHVALLGWVGGSVVQLAVGCPGQEGTAQRGALESGRGDWSSCGLLLGDGGPPRGGSAGEAVAARGAGPTAVAAGQPEPLPEARFCSAVSPRGM